MTIWKNSASFQFLSVRLESHDAAREVLEMGLFGNPHNLYLMEYAIMRIINIARSLLELLSQHFPTDLTSIEMLLQNIERYCDTYVIPKGPQLEAVIAKASRLLKE